ncbi:MAG: insulinase family protein [Deltaproteobacteria bacterium]|nr:insulinase family protein [Deltaproteobacteria bacterium]
MAIGAFAANSSLATGESSFTLDNGLKVIFAPQPGKEVVAVRVIVKAGSASEIGRDEYGLAHLMEHMAFKGTSRRKVGEIAEVIESNGGSTNAYTSFDETVYYIIMPSDKIELSLDLLSDMVFAPTYDPEEYAKEKEVVIEEIRRSNDQPNSILLETFYELAFTKEHPYGHRVIGSPETVENVSRETALAFHDKFYRPDNCVLVVTGGFDPALVTPLLDKYFKDFNNPTTPLVPIKVPQITPQGPKVEIIYSKETQLPKVVIGFTGPSAADSDAPTADLISAVLSVGHSSRLEENVKNKANLVSYISATAWILKLGGNFVISYETDRDKLIPAFNAVLGEIKNLILVPPSDYELSRSRSIVAKQFVDGQEAPWSLGGLLSSFEILHGDYRLKDAYLTLWSRLGDGDLMTLAEKIFRPENMTVVVILPEDSTPLTVEELLKDASALALPPLPPTLAEEKPRFEEISLENGVKVLYMRDSTLPLVELSAAVLGGRLAENEGKEGLNLLMASVWSKASKTKDSLTMAQAIDGLGITIDGFSGRNTTGLEGSFLSSNWRSGLSLYVDLLKNPAFNESDFAVKKAEQLDQILTMEESLAEKVFELLREGMYGNHPYSKDIVGTKESVEALTREDLVAAYNRLISPENLVFVVAGDINKDEFIAALQEELGDWKAPVGSEKVSIPSPPAPIKELDFFSKDLDRSQTHLAVGFLAPDIKSPDRPAMDVLNSLLSGMGGILFVELRDKKSLAYTVTSTYGPGLDVGSFAFYIATAPQKSGESLSGILEIIELMRKAPYDSEKVEGAKTNLIGKNVMSHITLGRLVGESLGFSLYGQELNFNDLYLDSVRKVTPEDVQRVAQKYLVMEEAVVAVVGSEESVTAAKALLPQKE